MKHIFGFLLFIAFSFPAFSQMSRSEYIQRYQLLAIEEMGRSGIPASIKMAQACLESGNGNSDLSRKSNNHFGIKCKSSWTGKRVYHDDDERGECFRKYKTAEESYVDHTNFLLDNPRYFFLFQLRNDDYVGWAKGLKRAGYATAHDYDKRLIKIIEENQLHRLDYRMSLDQITTSRQGQAVQSNTVSKNLIINPFANHEIIERNGVKSVVAKPGDTYEMIAQELGYKDWVLYKFNDQPQGYRPQPNEIIYVEAKNRKSDKNALEHLVQSGETMHYISQMYGLKLKPLYKRNGLKAGQQPQVGQIISLRNKR